MMKKKRSGLLALLLILCVVLAACGSGNGEADTPPEAAPQTAATESNVQQVGAALEASEKDPIKMAFVVPYELDSLPWLVKLCEQIPAYDEAHPEVEMTIVEALEADKYEPLCRSFCEEGYHFLFVCFNNFTDTVKTLSPEFPEVMWIAFDGYYGEELLQQLPMAVDFHENVDYAYLSGACAALMSETSKIGMVYGADIAFNMELAGAFEDGVYHINPDAEIINVITNTYVDPQVGYETAKSMINQGVDVIFANAGTTESGLLQACHEMGAYYVADGTNYEDTEYGDVQICYKMIDVAEMHLYMAEKALAGEFTGGEAYQLPYESGTTWFEVNEALVPPEIVAQLEELEVSMLAREFTVSYEPVVW